MSIVAKKIMMGSGAVALPSDDEFNRVSFLSHFDGANNGVNNAFDDGSASNHTITANGNVTQGSFGPFARPDGEWGVDFDGGGTHHCAADADFAFGTGDFCMEAWVFVDADDYNFSRVLSFGPVYGTGDSHGITVDHTDYSHKTRYYDSSSNFFLYSSAATPRNIWFHVAVTKASNTVRLFINGTVEDSGTNTNPPEDSSTNTVAIGNARPAEVGTGADFQGFISNARVVKGSAVYTSDFTPPTAPLTAITNTKLLTCQSNRFVDNSAEAHAILIGGAAGAVQVSAFGPFLTDAVYKPAVNGASASFDIAATTNLTAADSADWEFGSDNYTVEFWVYPRTTGTTQGVFNHWGDFNGNNVAWSFEYHSNGDLLYYFKTNNGLTTLTATDGATYANQWMHVTAVRNSNVHTLYLDGVSKASATNAGTMNNCTDVLRVGAYHATYGFNGEICDARIVKGTAVYTGNFTPPTAPLTAITNTKLLLNMANGQIIDNAAQSIAREVGSPVISTAQAKFGDTSLSVSGSSSVKFNEDGYSGFAFGTGDFTIEFWYYGDSTQNDYLFDTRLANDNEARASVYFNSNSKLSYYTSNTTRITSTTALTNNTWTHIALVRSSAVTRFYFNGTQDNQSFSDTLDMPSAQLVIGSKWNGTAFVTGYFDDFRVSKMARYTGNFTAPTAPFPDKGQ